MIRANKMKLLDIIPIITTSIILIGAIWQVAEIKNSFDKKLEIFISRYEERKEFVDYLLNDLNNKLDHKFQRCMDEIKNLKDS